MSKIIYAIGVEIPSDTVKHIDLDSNSSLSEADIVIFKPDYDTTIYSLDYPSTYAGKDLYNMDSSMQIEENTQNWRRELLNFLKTGKTVFIVLTHKEEFYIHTGRIESSGTGRNQKTTQIVKMFDNYKSLPISLKLVSSEGNNVYCCSPIIKSFYENFKDIMSYELYIDDQSLKNPLFTTKNKDKVLGASFEVVQGHLIFLPDLNFEDEKYYDSSKNVFKSIAKKLGEKFVHNLIEIDKAFNDNVAKTPSPNWIKETRYELQESLKLKNEIQDNLDRIEKIRVEIDSLTEKLHEKEVLKGLLYESGKELEKSVILALQILGYKAENYNDGTLELDQVILSPEGHRYVGECEGKDNKDIDITKFRQLTDSLNEDFARPEIEEKAYGILFGNAERFLEPEKRTLDFTTKCKKGAEREKIALVRTIDLFNVSKFLLENSNEDYKIECRKSIFVGLGTIVKFPDFPMETESVVNLTINKK